MLRVFVERVLYEGIQYKRNLYMKADVDCMIQGCHAILYCSPWWRLYDMKFRTSLDLLSVL